MTLVDHLVDHILPARLADFLVFRRRGRQVVYRRWWERHLFKLRGWVYPHEEPSK
jgi:hypothetical protein